MLKYNTGTNDFVSAEESTNASEKYMTVAYKFDPIASFGTIKEEYANVLKNIDEDMYILYSGGIDSEAVVEVAKDNNIRFTAVTMRYIVDDLYLNDHDYDVAKEYCNKHDIVHKVIDLDLNWFFEEDNYIPYSVKYQCVSPQLCCHLWLLDQLDLFCVMGGDLLNVDLKEKKIAHYGYKYTSYDRYFYLNNKKGISNLGHYSPEIMLATLEIYHQLNKRYRYTSILDYTAKYLMYNLGGFDLKQKQKFTGFEEIKQYYSDKYNEVGTIRTFDNMFRKPLEERVLEPNDILISYPSQITKMLGE